MISEPERDRRSARGVGRGAGAPRTGARANPAALDLAALKKDTDVACLYHCDFGDPQRFSQMLQNMLNHYSAYEFDSFKLKLVVVAHGAGLKFFLDDLQRHALGEGHDRSGALQALRRPDQVRRRSLSCARSPTSA